MTTQRGGARRGDGRRARETHPPTTDGSTSAAGAPHVVATQGTDAARPDPIIAAGAPVVRPAGRPLLDLLLLPPVPRRPRAGDRP